MAIIVKPMDEEFKVVISEGEDKINFFIKQLDYKTKSHITGLTTQVNQGQVSIDSSLVCFYNLKYGLKRVEGLEDTEGNSYKLKFEAGPSTMQALTDECVDELLATSFSDNLIYTARDLSKAVYPSKVLHPLTQEPLEGIEVIPAAQLKGTKKKS